MADVRASGPYIWVTWVTKLLSGGDSCEWASWFKAQHESNSWTKMDSTFDAVGWQINHTAKINENRELWEAQGYQVFTEGQNSFSLRGKSATIGGKPDLIAVKDDDYVIIDVKTGKANPSHGAQVLMYMYAIPLTLEQFTGVQFRGVIAYNTNSVDVPPIGLNSVFIDHMASLIRRLASDVPARKIPSRMECNFCDITLADCPERFSSHKSEGATTDF